LAVYWCSFYSTRAPRISSSNFERVSCCGCRLSRVSKVLADPCRGPIPRRFPSSTVGCVLHVVRIRPAQHSVARAIAWSIVLVLGIQSAWPVGHAAVGLATLQPSPDLAVAKQLRDEEINPGDKVAFVNSALLDHYWAHLAGVSVAAEVYDASQFWSAPPELKSKVISQLTQSGAKAIVARGVPAECLAAGWKSVPNTNYFLLIPNK